MYGTFFRFFTKISVLRTQSTFREVGTKQEKENETKLKSGGGTRKQGESIITVWWNSSPLDQYRRSSNKIYKILLGKCNIEMKKIGIGRATAYLTIDAPESMSCPPKRALSQKSNVDGLLRAREPPPRPMVRMDHLPQQDTKGGEGQEPSVAPS